MINPILFNLIMRVFLIMRMYFLITLNHERVAKRVAEKKLKKLS